MEIINVVNQILETIDNANVKSAQEQADTVAKEYAAEGGTGPLRMVAYDQMAQ